MKKTAFTSVIDKRDGPAMKEWAELTCRGWTIERLAAELGVDSTLAAVSARLTRGLPMNTRLIVEKVCREELSESERT